MNKRLTNVGNAKNNIMKSTLKIDTESRNEGEVPVIKIVQPIEVWNENDPDYDIRDKLIRNFLHTPCRSNRNGYFSLATYFPIPHEGEVKLHITTIAPVPEQDLLYRFRHEILNRFVPYESIISLNSLAMKKGDPSADRKMIRGEDEYKKIHTFFDWLDELERPKWKEAHPFDDTSPAILAKR